jgi:hypothetical protein
MGVWAKRLGKRARPPYAVYDYCLMPSPSHAPQRSINVNSLSLTPSLTRLRPAVISRLVHDLFPCFLDDCYLPSGSSCLDDLRSVTTHLRMPCGSHLHSFSVSPSSFLAFISCVARSVLSTHAVPDNFGTTYTLKLPVRRSNTRCTTVLFLVLTSLRWRKIMHDS